MKKLSDNFKVRKEFFGGLLFDFSTGKIVEINKSAWSIIYALHENTDPVDYLKSIFPDCSAAKIENDVFRFIETMSKKSYLAENGKGVVINNDTFSDHSLAAPRSVFWEASNRCNMSKCIHCYSYNKLNFTGDSDDHNKTDFENLLLEQISRIGVFTVDIGGGEPFLNPRLGDFIKRANENLIRCNVATNLYFDSSFVNSNILSVDWGKNTIQVSLDGLKEDHECIRGIPGCFDRTVENIKCLISKGIKVNINFTVMKNNYNGISDFVSWANGIGVSSVRFVRVIASGNASKNNLLLTTEQYRDMCILLEHKQKEYPDMRIKIDNSFMFLEKCDELSQSRIPWLPQPYVGCGAGRTLCNVSSTGDVYPCAYIYGDEYLCGNILRKDLCEIWKDSPTMNEFRDLSELESPCQECKMIRVCLGGCRANAIGYSNSIRGFDNGCWKEHQCI